MSLRFIGVLLSGWLVMGCSTVNQSTPNDPYESFNRSMFRVHEAVDTVVKPLAQSYDGYVPLPARAGLGNVFSNAGDLWVGANNLMQAKPQDAGTDFVRFMINSTLGLFGFFDVATEMGYDKHDEDLGQTLATWGIGSGGYVFLPFVGPRTLRDGGGWIVDIQADPLFSSMDDMAVRNSLIAVKAVHVRAGLLPTDAILEEATDDPYAYIREAYLQRRQYLIYDGNPPANVQE
jgi:phospholipid-binding lipoprotein MlaA